MIAQTLYVHRPVVNGEDIFNWAKKAGFKTVLPPDKLHVTLAYSKVTLPWPEPISDEVTIQPGGTRSLEMLGDGTACVLRFESQTLQLRWEELKKLGASWEWDGYRPHITLSWNAADLDLTTITPYTGEIILGGEIFEELNEDWKDTVIEKARLWKVDDSLGLVFGWAIISKLGGEDYYDTQGDHIPEDVMLKAAADFMENSRIAKEMHVGGEKGSVVFAWPLTSEIAKAMGIETKNTGLMIAMKPSNPDMLEKFKSGVYTGFSIGGFATEGEEVE